ncbi:hypothetical protein K502DRAFT_326133 [Neoconidiobolus thromboides FSU 785]|nr:hypothetical protein K502DRAFT_326133 [Neoconidiobolus thromboides FSU 785]
MQFNSIFLTILTFTIVNADKCLPIYDNCGNVSLPPNSNTTMEATFYSDSNFKGTTKTVSVKGIYGCTNDIPDFAIKSLLSTATTQITFHYGKDCVGHVIDQMMGGSANLNSTKACPGSVFIKLNRYGSC